MKMILAQTIAEVAELTRDLASALAEDRQDFCQELVRRRATAMEALLRAHEQATLPEKQACATALAELQEEDRHLRRLGEQELARTADAWRSCQGRSPQAKGSYDRPPLQACVDRQA